MMLAFALQSLCMMLVFDSQVFRSMLVDALDGGFFLGRVIAFFRFYMDSDGFACLFDDLEDGIEKGCE